MALLVLFAAFFSAVLLAVTSFARSFKEAQAYLIPLMLASIAPGMLSMIPGLKLQGPLVVTPLVNIVLLAARPVAAQRRPGDCSVGCHLDGPLRVGGNRRSRPNFRDRCHFVRQPRHVVGFVSPPKACRGRADTDERAALPGDHLPDVFSRVESAQSLDSSRVRRPAATGRCPSPVLVFLQIDWRWQCSTASI